jgi:hypothetical protein
VNWPEFVARLEAGDTWGDAANVTYARWAELGDVLAKGKSEHEADERTEDAAFYSECVAARAKAKAKLRDVMKMGTPAEAKQAEKMHQWLDTDPMPEPEPAAKRLHIESWSEESIRLADDLLRSLAGDSNPPRG